MGQQQPCDRELSDRAKPRRRCLTPWRLPSALLLALTSAISPIGFSHIAQAQTIAPAPDSTGTQVIPNGQEFLIQGGSLSGDGSNLFHSFEEFSLANGQTATFLSAPTIETILGRVTGSSASRIDGLLQVTQGNSQLILLNPNGIITGVNARLEMTGGFTAATANQVEFGDQLLTVQGVAPDYALLTGNVTGFVFGSERPGSVINQGEIIVGGPLRLLGGTVLNAGQLDGSSGNIHLVSLTGPQTLRLSGDGSITLAPSTLRTAAAPDAATLLSQLPPSQANGLSIAADGTVQLLGEPIPQGSIATSSQSFGQATDVQFLSQGAFVLPNGEVLSTNLGTPDTPITNNASLTVQAQTISGGSFNAGNPNGGGQVRPDAGNVTLTASSNISVDQVLGNQVNLSSDRGNISLSLGNATEGSRTVRGQNITLQAPEGAVALDGGIQAGEVERPTDGTITIEAESFRATNPFTNTALVGDGTNVGDTIAMSLWAYPANVPDGDSLLQNPDPLPQGSVDIRLADGLPQRVGSGNVLISIQLQADRFALTPGPGESGSEGDIGIALSRVPPNVNPLVLNSEFISLDEVQPTDRELAQEEQENRVAIACDPTAPEPTTPEQERIALKVATASLSIEEATPETLGLRGGGSAEAPSVSEAQEEETRIDGIACDRSDLSSQGQ